MEKLITHLDSFFKKHFDELEKTDYILLSKLTETKPLPKTGGIYVFYEGKGSPIYVGRTKNIRQRMQLHTRDSSKNESATFTFNLARDKYEKNYPEREKISRNDLMNNDDFKPIFKEQKERVKKMFMKYINEEHDILQTILEPYFALKLNTYPEHNKFKTH